MKNDFIKRQDVARFMFENRYSTSINNAYDQLKCIPVSYDLDGAIKELEEKMELAYNRGRTEVNGMKTYAVENKPTYCSIIKGKCPEKTDGERAYCNLYCQLYNVYNDYEERSREMEE